MMEISDGEISSKRSLLSFPPDQSYPHISCLNHAHVVPSITNSGHRFLGVEAKELDHSSLVCWGAPAANYHWTLAGQLHKLQFVVGETELEGGKREEEKGESGKRRERMEWREGGWSGGREWSEEEGGRSGGMKEGIE